MRVHSIANYFRDEQWDYVGLPIILVVGDMILLKMSIFVAMGDEIHLNCPLSS